MDSKTPESRCAASQESTVLWREAAPASKRLVIINKGPGALVIPREGKSWDLMEIFFMKKDIEAAKADPGFSKADHVVFETDRNMRKFAIIKRIFQKHSIFQTYDYILMLDDDLVPVRCSIGEIFDMFARSGLRVGQPALSTDSYWAHSIVLQNKRFKWRKTNFVEVMCPIMTQAALREYMPLFDATISNFGLDMYWSSQEWKKHGGLAVLDATPMRHTRPVRGGVAYEVLSPAEERAAFFEKYQLKNYMHLTFGGELSTPGAQTGNVSIFSPHRIRGAVKRKIISAARRTGLYVLLGLCIVSRIWRRGAVPPSYKKLRGAGRALDRNG